MPAGYASWICQGQPVDFQRAFVMEPWRLARSAASAGRGPGSHGREPVPGAVFGAVFWCSLIIFDHWWFIDVWWMFDWCLINVLLMICWCVVKISTLSCDRWISNSIMRYLGVATPGRCHKSWQGGPWPSERTGHAQTRAEAMATWHGTRHGRHSTGSWWDAWRRSCTMAASTYGHHLWRCGEAHRWTLCRDSAFIEGVGCLRMGHGSWKIWKEGCLERRVQDLSSCSHPPSTWDWTVERTS